MTVICDISEVPVCSDVDITLHKSNDEVNGLRKNIYLVTKISLKPAFAAMHGPHSLVRIGPGCADRA